MNPEELLEQAEHLIEPRMAGGEPRDADVRRAISAAYYAVFHYLLAAAAESFVGHAQRGTPCYTLVYRRTEHGVLSRLCAEVRKPKSSTKYRQFAPQKGFSRGIKSFAGALVELQEKRHSADYDPSSRFGMRDAHSAIAGARQAIERFANVDDAERQTFLVLLLFPPR